MEGGKKTILSVVLIVVIVAAVIIAVKRFGQSATTKPEGLLAQPLDKIDISTLKMYTKTVAEWDKLGPNGQNRWKNPETNQYTLAQPMPCAQCGATIPLPTGTVEEMRGAGYKCPKCGKSPFPVPGGPGPGGGTSKKGDEFE